MIYSVILAGGKGKRFWPVSREKHPKQFLSIFGNESLIKQTIDRLLDFTPRERIMVVTTSLLSEKVKSMGIKKNNIIIEPRGMNTLYAIALAAAVIKNKDPDATLLVLPSDHWIGNSKKFIEVLKKGVKWAEKGYIVTYGIVPNRPETGYGYIEKGELINDSVVKVKRFTEKPGIKTASKYIKSGNFLWNSGIFMWKASVILDEIKEFQPHLKKPLEKLEENPEKSEVENLYETGRSISIDYGVLERSKDVVVVRADFEWDDIGAWSSLERLYEKDGNGNIEKGDVVKMNSKNCIFYSHDGLIVAKGLENFIVVKTEDAILIAPKSEAQEVKNIVSHLPSEYK